MKSCNLSESQKKYIPIKRCIDIALSGLGIIALSPLMILLSIIIKVDSPGPVLFRQKRVGKDKKLFEIWKFRTMRTDTPKDMPTHLLNNPEIFITKSGAFLRKTSLDELPQIFNIFKGEMSVIGPRPALWNQYDLIAERDKYGANDITPGLTGWAQINGRDELEIPVKARLDGEYVQKFGLKMDIKCFLGTIGSVLTSDGVVEGGTGMMNEKKQRLAAKSVSSSKGKKIAACGITVLCATSVFLGIKKIFQNRKSEVTEWGQNKTKSGINLLLSGSFLLYLFYTLYTNIKRMVDYQDKFVNENSRTTEEENRTLPLKKVLITGADSYIGTSLEKWLEKFPDNYKIETLDMLQDDWEKCDFSQYDVVFHVAGIAHADIGKVTEEQKELYYNVNTKLAVKVAEKASREGAKQFIFMSSMIIYSGCKERLITDKTEPLPLNFYGNSKLLADRRIQELNSKNFKVVILRPPMIYGKESKGNYPKLAKLAAHLPVFPIVKNKRSMLFIDNLCQFIKLMIDNEESGVFFPQNEEYTNTSDLVQIIAHEKGHRIVMLPFTNFGVKLLMKFPGKIGGLANKAFDDFAYDMDMSAYKYNYRVRNLRESIHLTEGYKDE